MIGLGAVVVRQWLHCPVESKFVRERSLVENRNCRLYSLEINLWGCCRQTKGCVGLQLTEAIFFTKGDRWLKIAINSC